MTFQSTVPNVESWETKRMVNQTRITTAVQFCDRDKKEGRTMTDQPNKSLDQHFKKKEEILELLQQGISKVNQASQQEGTLEDQATMYVPTRLGSIKQLGSIRQTRATRAANQWTLEVQRVSKGIYLKFPNISKIFFVRPLVVCHLACSMNLGAQPKLKSDSYPSK